MKKLFKSVLVALMCFATTNVLAASKYDATRNTYGTTTEGIEVEIIDGKAIYTIPATFEGKNIYLNISDDVMTVVNGTYSPGDKAPFAIEVVNNSKFNYNYLNGSFKIDSLDLDEDYESEYAQYKDEVWYIYDYVNNKHLGKYIKGAYAFDGSLIRASYSINRSSNDAIVNLYMTSQLLEKEGSNYYYPYYGERCRVASTISSSKTICKALLTDDILGKELISHGYENGIADLHKYYLSYYNALTQTTATTLEELNEKAIMGYPRTSDYFYGGILNGFNASVIKETNPVVNAFGYNWFYNEGFSFAPEIDADGTAINEKDMLASGDYTIGDYMRKENPVLENVFKADLGLITSGVTNTLRTINMYIDGPKVVNSHQRMNLGFMMSFELQKETILGTLVVNHVDLEGNKLADTVTTTEEVDTEYITEALNLKDYFLVEVEGEATGKYIDGTIEVTYIYDKENFGDVEDEPIEPPHTDVETSSTSANLINIIVFDDRKKYNK